MTIEELRELKTGDSVSISGKYKVFTHRVVNDSAVEAFHFAESNSFGLWGNNVIFLFCSYQQIVQPIKIENIIKLSEKEVLESQLKEAEEQVQKETARVDSIKAKIEELTKPKLKIGGMYSFNYGYGILVGVLYDDSDSRYSFLTSNNFCRVVLDYTNGLKWEELKFKEITNPKYSHIGKTIMEFHNLKFGNT